MSDDAAGSLRAINPEPLDASVIECLEAVLKLARDGKVSAVAIGVVYRDGCTGSSNSVLPNRSAMIGALQQLQHRLMMKDYLIV